MLNALRGWIPLAWARLRTAILISAKLSITSKILTFSTLLITWVSLRASPLTITKTWRSNSSKVKPRSSLTPSFSRILRPDIRVHLISKRMSNKRPKRKLKRRRTKTLTRLLEIQLMRPRKNLRRRKSQVQRTTSQFQTLKSRSASSSLEVDIFWFPRQQLATRMVTLKCLMPSTWERNSCWMNHLWGLPSRDTGGIQREMKTK